MNKRDALLRYLGSDQVGGYVPAAFFLHFAPEFHRGQPAVEKHREFFEFTGMDFVKIQSELDFPKVEVASILEYDKVPSLPIEFYAPQLEVVKGLVNALKPEALVILTLYSPFMIAGRMIGEDVLIRDLERDPKHVFKALERITDSLVGFVRACATLGLDGFYHSTQGGESRRFKSPETFLKWVKPTDHRVMNEIDETFPFNILHICDYRQKYGGYDDLTPFLDYPGHVVNISTEIGGKHLPSAELSEIFSRPFMGGMDRVGPLANGTEAEARAAARTALEGAPPKFILGADCTVAADTPWANLRAACEEAHRQGS